MDVVDLLLGALDARLHFRSMDGEGDECGKSSRTIQAAGLALIAATLLWFALPFIATLTQFDSRQEQAYTLGTSALLQLLVVAGCGGFRLSTQRNHVPRFLSTGACVAMLSAWSVSAIVMCEFLLQDVALTAVPVYTVLPAIFLTFYACWALVGIAASLSRHLPRWVTIPGAITSVCAFLIYVLSYVYSQGESSSTWDSPLYWTFYLTVGASYALLGRGLMASTIA